VENIETSVLYTGRTVPKG